jgi:hypothetical protein
MALDIQHVAKVSETWEQLMKMTALPVFRAPRERARRSSGGRAKKQRRDVSLQDQSLSGKVFADENVTWKVLSPMWSEIDKQVRFHPCVLSVLLSLAFRSSGSCLILREVLAKLR